MSIHKYKYAEEITLRTSPTSIKEPEIYNKILTIIGKNILIEIDILQLKIYANSNYYQSNEFLYR